MIISLWLSSSNQFAMKKQKDILTEILGQISQTDFKEVYAASLYSRLRSEKESEVRHLIEDRIHSIQITEEIKSIITVEHILEAADGLGYGLAVNQDKGIFLYNKTYWESISELDFKHFLVKSLQKMGEDKYTTKNVRFIEKVYTQAQFSLYRSMQDGSGNIKINFLNSTLVTDIEGNVTEECHNKEDYFFHVLSYNYNLKAECPRFRKFLDEVLPEKDVQGVLQEFIGCCLNPSIKLEKVLCCVGSGFNGKSVFFEIILSLLGEDNVCSYNINSLCDDKGYSRAMIKNKLLNYSSDFGGKIFSNGIFKQLASGEPVEARRLYKEPEIVRNYARLAFNCNSMPLSADTSFGFRRRLLIVPFNVKIDKNKADPDLAKKLKDELPGILVWAIEGLKRFIRNGKKLSHSDTLDNLEQAYKEDTDSVVMFLERKGYKPDNQNKTGLNTLFYEYKTFCNDNNIKPETRENFKMKLKGEDYVIDESDKKKGVKVGIISSLPKIVSPFD